MTRAKSGKISKNRHKKILKLAKGYRGRASTCFRVAIEKVEKGLQYAYRDRRNRKRDFRGLWIQRINAAVRERGLVYSQFMGALKKAQIDIDRKVLAELAVNNNEGFASIVEQAKAHI
ncbi:50S ribosomal protein L20 [Rickettsia sp. MEAM1 (Bemisia tabaci)]|uniref:50S ribosomal protein L20 n=1 Tax=unclassified Rickettsia TaxID=114295 RepID=UPI0002E99823|nr:MULTISPECIES: 50S ribosomal protein L20 [unclassified Rickettsia]ASX28333.1 50S ribosomal protein L20 [Rickettsia sp. MEAM1 (Bemisia tabaci)]ODA37087.1 50S ribosomal protein L20 [Rickettsia sp. wb]ODA38483.1 50S ribosomal protein L20 [Rickettsia sp. wq]